MSAQQLQNLPIPAFIAKLLSFTDITGAPLEPKDEMFVVALKNSKVTVPLLHISDSPAIMDVIANLCQDDRLYTIVTKSESYPNMVANREIHLLKNIIVKDMDSYAKLVAENGTKYKYIMLEEEQWGIDFMLAETSWLLDVEKVALQSSTSANLITTLRNAGFLPESEDEPYIWSRPLVSVT